MTKINQSASPYFNIYNPNDRYVQIMAKPGKPLQAREINEMQSMMMDNLRKVSDTIMSDGSVISGMSFTINPNKVMIVENGLVYIDGLVRIFNTQSIQITGIGEENVGIKLQEKIVTYEQDDKLRDPAIGYKNYQQQGADRLQSNVVLTLNDPDAVTIFTLEDGELRVQAGGDSTSELLTSMLARRTYDESGNYRVEGLTLRTEPLDDNRISLIVEAGKAYIRGFEITRPVSLRVPLPKSRAVQEIHSETGTFVSGTLNYALFNTPVNKINRVQAELRVTREVLRKGVLNGRDELSKYSVRRIESVWIENVGGGVEYTYKAGTDYQLVNGHWIDWSPTGGLEPAPGATYYVTYVYNKNLEETVDYKLTINPERTKFNLTFVNNGSLPVPDSPFYVDYEFFLARKDLVSMNKEGAIVVTEGVPDVFDKVTTPMNTDFDLLHLGTVTLKPDSSDTLTNSYAVTRLRMEDLQRMLQRISDMEYNQAISALDDEAAVGENPTQLKGILSDGFHNLNKCDVGHPDFNITLDMEKGTITLPTDKIASINPTFGTGSIVHNWSRVITAPKTDEVLINQPLATGVMLVNPYNVFNKLGVLVLTPAVDNFVNERVVTVEQVQTSTYTLSSWWQTGGTNWTATERALYDQIVQGNNGWGTSGSAQTILGSSARTILDESVQYMREIEVTVRATNLLPFSDNLKVLFDGKEVSCTGESSKYQGTQANTLKADATGVTVGKFRIPPNTPCGVREVAVVNDLNTAVSNFTSYGRNRVIQNTVLVSRLMINIQAVTRTPIDPLAQTFQLDNQRIVSAVGLYFGSKDTKDNCIVQIRDVVNGYPGATVFAEKLLTPADIKTSEKGTVETVVKFDDPVLCEAGIQYCVVILTDSDVYTVFIAEVGKKELVSGDVVSRQPYLAGTLFSSSNAITWTAHQTQDMKFKIYGAKFETQGSIEFDVVTDITADRLVLLTEFLTPNNTGCEWYFRHIRSDELLSDLHTKVYVPIANYEETDLATVIKAFQLKAIFKSTPVMSPLLAKDALSLIGISTGLKGSYVARNVVFPQDSAYTTVKMVFEAFIPNGARVKPSYSTDGGTVFKDLPNATSVEDVDVGGGWKRYTFTDTISDGAKTNFRPKLTLEADSAYLRPKIRRFMNICK